MKHRLQKLSFFSIHSDFRMCSWIPATYFGIFNRTCGRFDFLTPIGIQFFGLFLQCCMMTCSTSQGSPSSFFSSLCHQQLASCKFRLLLRRTFCSTSFSGFIKSHQHKSFIQLLNFKPWVSECVACGRQTLRWCRFSFTLSSLFCLQAWAHRLRLAPCFKQSAIPLRWIHVAEAQAVDFGWFWHIFTLWGL